MKYACVRCGEEREIPLEARWPDGCSECGGTVWTSAPATPMTSFQNSIGAFDPASNAKALLRQPGSPLGSLRNVTSPT